MSELSLDQLQVNTFISNSAEAIILVNDKQQILEWNCPFEKFFSLQESLSPEIPLSAIFDQERNGDFFEHVGEAIKGKPNIIKQELSAGKKTINAEISITPLDSKSKNSSLILIFRPNKEAQISRDESKFKPLIEESPIATAIYRPDGTPKYFNKAYGAIWNAPEGTGTRALDMYNLLEDEQLIEIGLMPLVRKAFSGELCEIPPVPYTPANTHSIADLELKEQRYVKGHIFPLKDRQGNLEEVVMVLTDVTYQKRAEQILTDTHMKFHMLTVGLPGVIYEYEVYPNGQAEFKYISEGCEAMFGIAPEEVLENQNILMERIHPEDLESFLTSSSKSDKEFGLWNWEGRLLVDGKVKWIEGKSSPAKTIDDRIVRYGMLLDITDKKQTEHQYLLTEERLQLALQGAELGLWEWEANSKKTLINDAWAHKFGYKKGELERLFANWRDLVHPEDLPMVSKRLNEHLEGKREVFEAEYRFKTKSGDYRWIMDKGRAIERAADGRLIRSAGTYLDINEKKLSDLLIRRNEQLFTQLFQNSPLGIVLLDEQHKVIQMNKGFEDIFGYAEEEIVGNKLNNILVPEDLMQEALDINLITSSGQVGKLESYRLSKSGEKIPLIIYGVPVSLENQTIGIYGIYVDITDRKRAEEELQIRNSELDNFVYKVSHDLRAPLSSILGLIYLANHDSNEDDLKNYIQIIESRVKQLDGFINDVLSHSKNLKQEVTIESINFSEVVDKCFDELSYLKNAHKVDKQLSISSQEFYSDRWRVNEIFRNLISNSIKYLNPEIDNPYVKINIEVNDQEAMITLEDNGIGIDDQSLTKVFDMFYRATASSEGSGIGLYIVKNAIEKIGGTIDISSKENAGTKFSIKLPNLR